MPIRVPDRHASPRPRSRPPGQGCEHPTPSQRVRSARSHRELFDPPTPEPTRGARPARGAAPLESEHIDERRRSGHLSRPGGRAPGVHERPCRLVELQHSGAHLLKAPVGEAALSRLCCLPAADPHAPGLEIDVIRCDVGQLRRATGGLSQRPDRRPTGPRQRPLRRRPAKRYLVIGERSSPEARSRWKLQVQRRVSSCESCISSSPEQQPKRRASPVLGGHARRVARCSRGFDEAPGDLGMDLMERGRAEAVRGELCEPVEDCTRPLPLRLAG